MHDLTAVLLCGGKGERLRPITESVPKPLVEINGIPLLEHLLRYLTASGIRKSVLCVGYKAEAIRQFAARRPATDHELVCVDSGDAPMTDRILDARKHVPGRALICYGDTLANVDLAEMTNFHEQRGGTATVTVYPMYSPFGVVEVQKDGLVDDFREKPRLPYWINIGFMLCEPTALNQIRRNSGIPQFLASLRDQRSLFAYQHDGRHLTVNTEKERQLAEAEITEFYTVIEPQPIMGREIDAVRTTEPAAQTVG